MEGLPIVSLAGLAEGDPSALARVAAELGHACREIGFFYVTDHGVPRPLIAEAFRRSAEFFGAPPAVKRAVSIETVGNNRGYGGLLTEALDPTKPADLKEAFNMGLELDPGDPDIAGPFRGLNGWPAIPGSRDTLLAYYDACWALGRRIHRAFAADLGLPLDFFESRLDKPMATLRLLHYPPHPEDAEAGQIGAGEHTDYGNITLLMTDEVGGLEVRRRDGTWLAAPVVPGAFVVNIGDCLMRWSNDVYVSTPHRVVNRGGRERYSIAFFLDPNPDADVAALPGCVPAGGAPRHPPISGADYLKSRLDATYSHRRKS